MSWQSPRHHNKMVTREAELGDRKHSAMRGQAVAGSAGHWQAVLDVLEHTPQCCSGG